MEQWNNENTEYTNQTITIKQGWGKMLEKEKNQHKGCPNRGYCQKEESKCCYLLNNNICYLDYKKSEDFK